jgi:MFS family permease
MPTSETPGQRRALAVLVATMVLAMAPWFSAAAVLPQLRAAWSLSSSAGAWLTISVQIGFVVGALGSAAVNLADRVEPERLLLVGATGAGAANLGLLVASGASSAMALRFATGVFLAVVYPPAMKAVATWFREGRGTAMGIMVGALTLGSALPYLVNGFGGAQWQTVVAVTTAMAIAGGVLGGAVFEQGPYRFPAAPFDPAQVPALLRHRGVRLATLGYFGHMWELYAMWAWFAAFYADASSSSNGAAAVRTVGLVTFAVIGAGAVGSWAGGRLSDQWGRAEAAATAMALSGTCALVVGQLLGGPLWVLVLVALLWGFSVVADSAQFSAIVSEVADQRYVGTAVTLQLATGFVLTVATIWLVPLVRDQFGWSWALALLALGPFAGVVAMVRLRPLLAEGGTHGS